MDNSIARVNELDPAPVLYSLRWLLRSFYEAEPRHCIALVVPDDASRDAAREVRRKKCKRWDCLVGALRSSYVCIVVMSNIIDNLREDLQYNSELDFRGEMRVYCAVASRHEMKPFSASPGLEIYIEASKDDKNG